jgi:Recombinase
MRYPHQNEIRISRARRFAADLAPTIKGIQDAGTQTLSGIADELNRRGIPTASGKGKWQAQTVRRLLARLAQR